MTDQIAHQLVVEFDEINIDGLLPYGLIRGDDPRANHGWGSEIIKFPEVEAIAKKERGIMTSLHSGYVPTYRLLNNGELVLQKIHVSDGMERQYPVESLPGSAKYEQLKREGVIGDSNTINKIADKVVYELVRHSGKLYLVNAEPEDQMDMSAASLLVPTFAEHQIDRKIEGDFWMVLKPAFRAPRTYIPFIDGKIVVDQGKWVFELIEPTLPGKKTVVRSLIEKLSRSLNRKERNDHER